MTIMRICILALMTGFGMWSQVGVTSYPRTCIEVVDELGREVKDWSAKTFVIVGSEVTSIGESKCLSGREGSRYVLVVSASGYFRSTVAVELDGFERTRIVHLRVDLLESRSSIVRSDVGCQKARCSLKAVQIDGEVIYTVKASNQARVSLEAPRPGSYVLTLERDGAVTCALPVRIGSGSGEFIDIDLARCTGRTK